MSKVKSSNFFASNAQIFDDDIGLQVLGLPSIPGLIVAQDLLPRLRVCCRFCQLLQEIQIYIGNLGAIDIIMFGIKKLAAKGQE